MKVMILGMGNPILSDDGVGLFVAEILRDRIRGADVEQSAMIGLNLFDLILGYDILFIVDAMTTAGGVPGELRKVSEEDRRGTLHLFSSHGLDIFALMDFGSCCGFKVPRLGAVYGIEIGCQVAFGEALSPALAKKLPALTEEIIADMVSILPDLSVAAAPREGPRSACRIPGRRAAFSLDLPF